MRHLLLVAALGLAACASDDDSPAPATSPAPTDEATTTTADVATADHQLIVGLFRSLSDAWFGGEREGFEAEVAAQYPGTGYTVDECIAARFGGELPPGLSIESVVDQTTIQPDPDWTVPGGPLDGLHPEGRTYIMSVKKIATAEGASPQEATSEIHATVLDGKAYIYSDCD